VIDHLRAAWDEMTAPGAPFAMTETTVRGIPMRVFASALPDLRAMWELSALQGDKIYVVYEDERYSFADIHAQVRSLAGYLHDDVGVRRGDRVALAMRNYPEWVVGHWAAVSLGAAVVGMNAWWTGPEMEYALGDSLPKVLIADDERLERVVPHLDAVREKAPLDVIAVRPGGELPADAKRWVDVVDAGAAPASLPAVEVDPDDDALVFYTSGTTGFPKGAQITHRGAVHNVFHLMFWTLVSTSAEAKAAAAAVEAGSEPIAEPPPAPEQPVFMAPTPLFHVTACNCILHPATIAGGRVVFTHKWDAGRALELIEREGVTNFAGVPTMLRELISHPDWPSRDTSTMRGLGGGGAPVAPDLVEKMDKSLSRGGTPSTGYGLTETSGVISANGTRYLMSKPSSAGPVLPTLDAKLVDETGVDLEPGEDTLGQLCVRGPVVIKGYLNRPEATAEAIRDGWFNTGDIARLDDDGFLYIVDRAKDMVLRGGENVYCSEVEAAIYQHDDVAEVAVFGVPDERLGEAVGAAIVPRDGAELTDDDVVQFLHGKIAKHKVPSAIWILDEPLPRNASGKFLKRELRTRLVESGISGSPETSDT
jgi:acyl-CoA synthetase (AMP-forming)/AMP-acid ligase II